MQKVQPLSVREISRRPAPATVEQIMDRACRVCGKMPLEHSPRLFIAHTFEGARKKDGTTMTAEESRLLAQRTVEPLVAKLPAIFEELKTKFERYD